MLWKCSDAGVLLLRRAHASVTLSVRPTLRAFQDAGVHIGVVLDISVSGGERRTPRSGLHAGH